MRLGVVQASLDASLAPAAGATATPGATASAGGGTKAPVRADAIRKAAGEFESLLVRQMLSHVKIAGEQGGYGDMATDALATSLSAAGGLGLARELSAALGATHDHARVESRIDGGNTTSAEVGQETSSHSSSPELRRRP